MTPHKHAEVIKAWADGAAIQYRLEGDARWHDLRKFPPGWSIHTEYRVKPEPPHKWQHLIDAQAAGKICQMKNEDGDWVDGVWLFNAENGEYRLKPDLIKFRTFLWESQEGNPGRFSVGIVHYEDQMKEPREKWPIFIRWIGDWQTVELPEKV